MPEGNFPSLPSWSPAGSQRLKIPLRRVTMICIDGLLIIGSVLGAFVLRLQDRESLQSVLGKQLHLLPLAVVSGLLVLSLSRWYRGLTRYSGSFSLYGLLPRATLMVLILFLLVTITGSTQPPRSFWILYWLLFTGFAIGTRIILRDILLFQLEKRQQSNVQIVETNSTLIYGAGSSGLSLLNALRNDPRFRIVCFLDDDIQLHGRTLQNLPIVSPSKLPSLVERHNIRKVLLALPSISRQRKRHLVDHLTHRGLEVLSIPSLQQLARGHSVVSDLQTVSIEDLLGREPSSAQPELLLTSVENKNVLVTGAGGSIGSELCRQIVGLKASSLILVERNEYALYSIDRELRTRYENPVVHPILGDASDQERLVQLCKNHQIDTIFHAAAYKHVPIVESNLCAGVSNNIRSTRAVIHAAMHCGVKWLTLISTDKAVRPTNAMGASKRVCELMIQAAAAESSSGFPIMSMVRFGNVLGSSGSVIPLFHQQIAMGGPVTVTHPAITRYFMTIPEAVQLVLQATGMAKGGDLFLLDMGEPVRIADLARQMIELSGLRIRDEQNPDGDIDLKYTGLRPGEKLYEELLISAEDQPTAHPLIRRANEPGRSMVQLMPLIHQLEQALSHWDEESTTEILQRLVPEYQAQGKPIRKDFAVKKE